MGWLNKVSQKKIAEPGSEEKRKKIHEIWRIEEISDFGIALNQFITEKCQDGDDMWKYCYHT
ncbi:MAG: hypothetical protein ACI4DZ_03580 [Oliverpabstia sp.]